MGKRKSKQSDPPIEHSDWGWNIGDRAKHYGSGQLGTIRAREMRLDPMYGDEDECYLLEFDSGGKEYFFDRQLEIAHEKDGA